jgi:hypothetical protein
MFWSLTVNQLTFAIALCQQGCTTAHSTVPAAAAATAVLCLFQTLLSTSAHLCKVCLAHVDAAVHGHAE